MSGSVRIFFERQRPQACEIHGGGSSSKHIYGGALYVNDQIIPGTYFYEWVRDLSNIPREHRLYDMYIYTLSFARGWFLQLSAGACGHRL